MPEEKINAKDEAWNAVVVELEPWLKYSAGSEEQKDVFRSVRAYAAACVAEALVDPLALLEALADRFHQDMHIGHVTVGWKFSDKERHYQHWREMSDTFFANVEIPRAEAAALLGKEKGDE